MDHTLQKYIFHRTPRHTLCLLFSLLFPYYNIDYYYDASGDDDGESMLWLLRI